MREDSVTRNAGFAFATKMVGAALTAGLTIFLGRQLSASAYGAFAFAISAGMLLSLFADLSISASAQRFIGERRGNLPAVAGVVATTLRLKVVLASATSVALFVLAGPLCRTFGIDEATGATRGIAVSLFSETLFLFVLATFVSVARIRFNTLLAFCESVTEVGASIALVLVGAGATGAAFGRAIGYAVGLALGLHLLRRLLGPLWRRGVARAGAVAGEVPRGHILRYAAPLIAVDVAFRVFESIDVLLVASIVGGAEHVAAFQLPMRLAMFLDYPVAAISQAVAPRLSRGPEGPDLPTFVRALRLTTMIQMVFVAPLLVWPETIIHILFGNKYPEAAGVLRALVPFVVLSGVAQLATVSVNYLGEGRRRVPYAILMVAVNVVIDIVLLGQIGVVGAAIGTSVAYAIWVPSHLGILHRHVGLPLRPVIVTTLRALAAAGAMSVVLLVIGTGRLGTVAVLAGVVLGPLAYVAGLVVSGELRRDDLVTLRRLAMRR
ncbi:MAG TPA: oligosaccharide flippase family protein [Baekduia sp.]|nr:oligosaccharide flippase family protein [Baekduia sp.]